MEVKTTKAAQTKKIAYDLAKSLKGGEVIAIYGDLGVGKTIFTQGLAKGLGIKGRILSPTFVFMRTYAFKKSGKEMTLYHIDLYRGQDWQDFENLGLEEVFSEGSVVVLEWAEKIQKILPKKRIEVYIRQTGEKNRSITIKIKK